MLARGLAENGCEAHRSPTAWTGTGGGPTSQSSWIAARRSGRRRRWPCVPLAVRRSDPTTFISARRSSATVLRPPRSAAGRGRGGAPADRAAVMVASRPTCRCPRDGRARSHSTSDLRGEKPRLHRSPGTGSRPAQRRALLRAARAGSACARSLRSTPTALLRRSTSRSRCRAASTRRSRSKPQRRGERALLDHPLRSGSPRRRARPRQIAHARPTVPITVARAASRPRVGASARRVPRVELRDRQAAVGHDAGVPSRAATSGGSGADGMVIPARTIEAAWKRRTVVSHLREDLRPQYLTARW